MYDKEDTSNKTLTLNAKDSDIVVKDSVLKNIDIKSLGNVSISNCETIENIDITANTIKIPTFNLKSKNLNLKAEYVEMKEVYLGVFNNINVNSNLILLEGVIIYSPIRLNLKSDMIYSKRSRLSAKNKIEITNFNCDEIKGVDAPLIIYNGKNITYSEGILFPKLKSNLVDVLKQLREKVKKGIDVEIEDLVQAKKQCLENKPITKILKK